MKKLFFLFFFLIGCIDVKSKENHKYTVNLYKYKQSKCGCKLYIEGYLVYGMGALGSDLYSEYLTDSSNFRVYLGNYDENDEKLLYYCKNDSFFVEKRSNKGFSNWDTSRVINKKAYSIKDLKIKHITE